ncbi:electroneutral sodium bicarbonate exchanger 1-like isoform X3 [Gordionus sp. m RMFG-2023]|uniref:electroneutral sodium bicarbonate exchanger 1-like isoform X3 n=1 Tax=Gordionus sp. m RMFG-2023 TaxID=3053472 RepID=UPI0031FC1F95
MHLLPSFISDKINSIRHRKISKTTIRVNRTLSCDRSEGGRGSYVRNPPTRPDPRAFPSLASPFFETNFFGRSPSPINKTNSRYKTLKKGFSHDALFCNTDFDYFTRRNSDENDYDYNFNRNLLYHNPCIVDPAEHVHLILGGSGVANSDQEFERLFIQMDELRFINSSLPISPVNFSGPNDLSNAQSTIGGNDIPLWEEVARWVKFEEDVEPGSNRWSKPRVATLALHSLLELRSCILNGMLILDMEGSCPLDIENNLISSLLSSNQITTEIEADVRGILKAPHVSQYMKNANFRNVASKSHFPNIASLPVIGPGIGLHAKFYNVTSRNVPFSNNYSNQPSQLEPSPTNKALASNGELTKVKRIKKISMRQSKTSPGPLSPTHNLMDKLESSDNGSKKISLAVGNWHFMKKLPENVEAAHVLIGEAPFLQNPIITFVRLRDAVYLADATEVPIPSRFIFLLIGPIGYVDRYHEIGRCLATLMSDEVFHDVAYKAKNIQDILAGVDEFLDQVIVLPPGEWDPTIRIQPPLNIPSQLNRISKKCYKNGSEKDEFKVLEHDDKTLVKTGKFCGGLKQDIKRKLPWYFWSDITDGLSMQCLASFFFLYFACLAPIVTFGGLLGDATGHNLATIESLLSGAICGITWSLFAGQPLTIMGSTGPILVFESIVFSFCRDQGLNYLSFRCCIGLWTCLILLVIVATDASVLVKYVTRFTEELFASLISLIFVYQALKNIYHISKEYPVIRRNPLPLGRSLLTPSNISTLMSNYSKAIADFTDADGDHGYPHVSDVFFLSVILFLGTFLLSLVFKSLRNTTYFPMIIRYTISDFSVLFAVLLMLGLDFYYGLATPKLLVPRNFRPTSPLRKGWFVNPLSENPWWTSLVTVFPALLATILIFMDQQITAVIINRKENLLKKGCGYHLDLLVVSLLVAICSLLGIPWFVAATVLSITHVNSLREETECSAPGERPKFLGVREQRLTGFLIFVFIGLSVTMTKLLQYIPMPVLYGVFLYMGISSLKGVQFIQRISIFFMPQKYQPDYMFLRSVKTYRVHIFTAIQLLSLAALWAIKSYKSISICFPIMVVALVGIRKLMEKIFTPRELSILDDVMPEAEKKRKSMDVSLINDNNGSSDPRFTQKSAKNRVGLRHKGRRSVNSGLMGRILSLFRSETGVCKYEPVKADAATHDGDRDADNALIKVSIRPQNLDIESNNFDEETKHFDKDSDAENTTHVVTNSLNGGSSDTKILLSPHIDVKVSLLGNVNSVRNKLPQVSSLTDTMNITREVERTAVWKSLAKEKFITNASASAINVLENQMIPVSGTNPKIHQHYHKHHHKQHHSHQNHSDKWGVQDYDSKSENKPFFQAPDKFSIRIGSDDEDDGVVMIGQRYRTNEEAILDPAKISINNQISYEPDTCLHNQRYPDQTPLVQLHSKNKNSFTLNGKKGASRDEGNNENFDHSRVTDPKNISLLP